MVGYYNKISVVHILILGFIFIFKKIESIIYHSTLLIYDHVVEGLVIIQAHFDYINSLFINKSKIDTGYKLSRRNHGMIILIRAKKLRCIIITSMSTVMNKLFKN